MALDATVGGAAANSYLTRAEANTYFASRLRTDTWDAATDDEKDKALQMATQLLDASLAWHGQAVTETQALAWPRYSAYGRNGYVLSWTAIPVEVQQATAELAQKLLDEDRTADSDAEADGLKRLKAGPVELEFRDDARSKPIPDFVYALVRHLAALINASFGSAKLVRV